VTAPWDALGKGAALYNQGKFYEAHEVWEELWLELEDEPRLVVQGLIQAAAAGHKAFAQRQPRGCVKLLESALAKLDVSPAIFHGIDIDRFRAALRTTLAEAEQWLRGDLTALSQMPALGTPYRSPTE
jgi:predicted metal-dependent hydrolase